MSKECKYCTYVEKCPGAVCHNSIYCMVHKEIPKNINKSYEQLQNENKQLKDNWNKLKKELRTARKLSLPISTFTVGQLDVLIHKMNCMELEKGDSNE